MEIRQVRDSDWPELLRIERDEYGADAYSVHFVRMLPVLFGLTCWVAEDEVVCGYCLAARVDSQPSEAWLLAVVVAVPARGQGVARQLTTACFNSLQSNGVATVRLTVERDNVAAVRLYESLGFSAVGDLLQFFGPGEDRLLMALDLATPST